MVPPGPLYNILWLLHLPSKDRALVLGCPQPELVSSLTAAYGTVSLADVGCVGFAMDACASFDLIAINFVDNPAVDDHRALLEICARGAAVVILRENLFWARSLLAIPGFRKVISCLACNRLMSGLRVRGFSKRLDFFADPRVFQPACIIPVSRSAVMAHQATLRERFWGQVVKRFLARLGILTPIYPAYISVFQK